MAKSEELLAASIMTLLRDEPHGLQIADIVMRLHKKDGGASPRSVRYHLNQLEREGLIVKQRQPRRGTGAPPYVYLHPDNLPRQLRFFDDLPGVKLGDLLTKYNLQDQDNQEREAQARATGVLRQIAMTHVGEDSYARAIIDIAPQLANENPVELLMKMVHWTCDDLNDLGRLAREAKEERKDLQEAEKIATELEVRLMWAKSYFRRLMRLDRPIGREVRGILKLPSKARHFINDGEIAEVVDKEAAQARFAERVFGERVINILTLTDNPHSAVAGTDASVADVFLSHPQGSFIPPDLVSIMTGAAALKIRPKDANHYQDFEIFDIYPNQMREFMDQQAAVRGLVISPALKNLLPESDFKHSRLASMDMRQYEEDLRAAQKKAKWRPVGAAPVLGIPLKPSLIIRDGRLFPLVHRLRDYEDDNLYGQIVREQFAQFDLMARHIFSSPLRDTVYGAAVKTPEMSWLAPLVFWYLFDKKVKVGGKLVIDEFDVYRYPFPDSAVAHLLFLGMTKGLQGENSNAVFTTFRLLRRFSDIAFDEGHLPPLIEKRIVVRQVNENEVGDWREFIEKRIEEKEEKGETSHELRDYDHFINLCAHVGASMCYAAPASIYGPLSLDEGEGTHFLLPRLEVLVQVSGRDYKTVEQNHLESMLSWMVAGGLALDGYHTDPRLSPSGAEPGLPILVPDVVILAHEAATFARDKLSEEVKDEIQDHIADLRKRLTKRRDA